MDREPRLPSVLITGESWLPGVFCTSKVVLLLTNSGRLPGGECTGESQLPGDEYTRESWIPWDEVTVESWLPSDEYTGEFRVPGGEHTWKSDLIGLQKNPAGAK